MKLSQKNWNGPGTTLAKHLMIQDYEREGERDWRKWLQGKKNSSVCECRVARQVLWKVRFSLLHIPPLEPLVQRRMAVSHWYTWSNTPNLPFESQSSHRVLIKPEVPPGSGWPQKARADKNHHTETHLVMSLLFLDFKAGETTLDPRGGSSILLFSLLFSPFLVLTSSSWNLGNL